MPRDLDGLGSGFLPGGIPDPFVVSSQSICCLGHPNNATGSTAVSTTWQTANRAIFMPFTITGTRTYVVIGWMNGATVAGTNHIDVGIYSGAGSKLVSTGSTVQTGTSTTQQAVISQVLTPGTYFFACVMDNATDTLYMPTISSPICQSLGIRHLSAFFPLGADASAWVGTTQSRIPMMFISELSTI